MSNNWEMVIGLEVHAQLKTSSKLFSSSPNLFGSDAALPLRSPRRGRGSGAVFVELVVENGGRAGSKRGWGAHARRRQRSQVAHGARAEQRVHPVLRF